MRHRMLRQGAVLACLVISVSVLGAPGAAAAPGDQVPNMDAVGAIGAPCPPGVRPVPSPNPGITDVFYGAAALSIRDAWAVGQDNIPGDGNQPLAEHWDGQEWTVAANPPVLPHNARLTGVAAFSANDVWAVGDSNAGPYIQHWDGQSWRVVSTPELDASASLASISGSSPDDVWAVGFRMTADPQVWHTLIEHWDGTSWTVTSNPDPPHPGTAMFHAVTARAHNDAWAVGWYGEGPATALIEHWDGTDWSISASSGRFALSGVSASAPDDAWAVGNGPTASDTYTPFATHWNGVSWVPGGSPPTVGNAGFSSVLDLGDGNVWATGLGTTPGDRYGGDPVGLIEQYDGNNWTLVSQQPLASMYALAATSPAYVWIAGYSFQPRFEPPNFTRVRRICPIDLTDSGFRPITAQVSQGEVVSWFVDGGATTSHSVTDASGLDLFDSGMRRPGQAFDVGGGPAATYPVVDKATNHRSLIRVPAVATPATGTTSTSFTIRWALTALPKGTAADVEVAYCSQTGLFCLPVFRGWKAGTSDLQATFDSADPAWRQQGTYYFRARLRGATGQTGWSPAASVKVS
jgi:hypothetical protein